MNLNLGLVLHIISIDLELAVLMGMVLSLERGEGMLRCVLITVLQKNRPNRRYMVYYKDLAHIIMEAEKF